VNQTNGTPVEVSVDMNLFDGLPVEPAATVSKG
jgi:hypothetical protein